MLRIKNVLLLFSAFVAMVPRRRVVTPARFLVVQGAKLGDMVCTTPLFRAIKEKYPHSYLVVMGNALNRELLAGHPHIDAYHIRPRGWFALWRVLYRERFDFACITAPDPEVLAAMLCARVPEITAPKVVDGWSPYETLTFRLLRRFARAIPHRMGSYAPREYLRLLEPLSITSEDTRKELVVSEGAVEGVKAILVEKGCGTGDFLVGIAPGVGNKIKLWGGEKFARVAEVLEKKYNAKIIIVGAGSDRAEVEKMKRALPKGAHVIDLSGTLSLEELKALISQLNLFISVDTGPIYIAEAFGIPTVGIVGPMDEWEQPPQGKIHRVVVPERNAPALHILNATRIDIAEARRQAETTTPEEVLEQVELLLKDLDVANIRGGVV